MRCIHCGKDNKYDARQKTGGCCEGCGHRFAFEPKTEKPSMTDRLFEQVIDDVSGHGRLAFTERQLWYSLGRRMSRWKWSGWFVGAAILGFVLWAIGRSFVVGVVAALVVLLVGAIVYLVRRFSQNTAEPRLDFDTFRSRLRRWNEVHGKPARLLDSPRDGRGRLIASSDGPTERPNAEPDLTAYSFDRAVVTDRHETAAMLVANNFHFEHNCAVLSVNGYPIGRAETILEMLRRNPDLQVFAVHDASVQGCELPIVLRRPSWFPDLNVSIVDVGLRPRHVRRLRLPVLAARNLSVLSLELTAYLTRREADWLKAGNVAELAALPPGRLMRAIFRSFSRSTQAQGDGDGHGGGFFWFFDAGDDAGADADAADSFG